MMFQRFSRSQTRGTYLAIRNFFIALACPTQPKRTFSASAHYSIDHETEALYTSAAFYPESHAPPTAKSRTLTAADDEWLQEGLLDTTSNVSRHIIDHTLAQERFDWRLRAPSRIPKPPTPPDQKRWKRYTRRKQPPPRHLDQGEPSYSAVASYETRFLKLLAAEQEEAEAALKERLTTWSLDRLKEEGYCLTSLSAFWLHENQFGRPIASFGLGPGLVLPDHRFENGTEVLISRIDPVRDGEVLKGAVVSSSASRLKISFDDIIDEVDEGEWRIDVGHSDIIYRRLREAVKSFREDPSIHEEATYADPQPILVGTHLRDILLQSSGHPPQVESDVSQFGAFKNDMRVQSWARRYAEQDPVAIEGDPVIEGLNNTQLRAVATMIGQRISLIQGPPGTGKTKTIIEAVKLLKVHFEVPHPILVCTYTNVAVDNLVEGLVNTGVKALRVGSGKSVRDSIVRHTLDHKLSEHPLSPQLEMVQDNLDRLHRNIEDLKLRLAAMANKKSSRAQDTAENMKRALLVMLENFRRLKSKKFAIRQEMLHVVVSDADVICTTCITSACVALKVTDFPVVFLDEASMSTEPASLIPIMKGSRHISLIGDHKQLPPVITSPEAEALGLSVSLFERLTEEGVVPSIMLDTQYRMHPAISRFPSSEFYDKTLQDGTVDAGGIAHARLHPPNSQHLRGDEAGNRPSVIFIDHAGAESMKERSRVNLNEAHLVVSIIEDLLLHNPQLMGYDIGIIAPYVAQISLLTRLLNRDANYKQRFREVLGDQRAMQVPLVEIKTVDGFEGREKEVIIFSTVRNNQGGYIGFLADKRRLNVGLTRARRGLFVVGSLTTLQRGKRTSKEMEREALVGSPSKGRGKEAKDNGAASWRRYAKYLAEHGLVVKLEGDALGQALYGNLNAAKNTAVAVTA